jgi:hypothetical protein
VALSGISRRDEATAAALQQGGGRRLLVAAPCIPDPVHGASAVLFYWYIEGLVAAGYRVLNVLLLEQDPEPSHVEAYRRVISGVGSIEIQTLIHPNPIGTVASSPQIDPAIQISLSRMSDAFDPDLVLCLDLRCAWSAALCQARVKVAWLGDLNFQTFWYHALYARKEGLRSWWKLPLDLLRSWQWRKPYREALAGFSRILVASKSSEKALAGLGIDATYLPYPWPATKPHKRNPAEGVPILLFCGSLGGLGSRSSFHFLIEHLYPALRRLYGPCGFRIRVCGHGTVAGWIEEALRTRPEFEVLGFVPDLEPVLAASHALIVPVEVPVGNRSRILTALSQKLLVIAHTNTALGNPDLRDGENCYLATTPEEFVHRIGKAIAEPATTNRITACGFDLYQQKFAPRSAVSFLLHELAQLH